MAQRRQCRSGDHRPCRGPRLLRRRRRRHPREERQRATRARPRPSSSPNTASTICCSLIPSRRSRSWTGSRWAAGSALRCRATSGSRPKIPASRCPKPRIGLFPDVGGGWYLSRLPGRVGQFMVLTGARLDGAECHYLRLATHYAEQGRSRSWSAASSRRRAGSRAYWALPPESVPPAKIEANLPAISRLFASDRLEEILAALGAERSEWAADRARDAPAQKPAVLQGLAAAARRGGEPHDFADEMARRICARQPGGPHPRFPRRRSRGADRQGQCAALGPADAGGGDRRDARRAVRAASAERRMDALPGDSSNERVRHHPGRAARRGDAGHAKPPAGAQRAQQRGAERTDRRLRRL